MVADRVAECGHNHKPIQVGRVNTNGFAEVHGFADPNYQLAKPFSVKLETPISNKDPNAEIVVSIPKLNGTGEAYTYAHGRTMNEALAALKCVTLGYKDDL